MVKSLYCIALAAQLLLCVLVAACSSPQLDDGEEVAVVMPREGSTPSAARAWLLVCADGFGERREERLGSLEGAVARLARNTPSAVLAYPLDGEGAVAGHPYGAVYPFSAELNTRDGFAASVLYDLYNPPDGEYSAGIAENVVHFNWPKFMELCASYEDPWRIQEERVMRGIRRGTFKKTDIKIDGKKD